MNDQPLYRLAEHGIVEPLIDHWIAWPHNFPPLVYSLHLLYQQEVLASYLENTVFYKKSCRSPKLLGDPFVDVPQHRAAEVRELLAAIERNHADLLQLGRDLTEFQNMLAQSALGQCIESYYAQLPDSLSGFIELGYDYHNHAVLRCIESLFYECRYHKKNTQSLRISSLVHDDERAYYMSMPRLTNSDDIEWRIPSDDHKLDELLKLDIQPQSLGTLSNLLNLTAEDEAHLIPLLTSEPSVHAMRWTDSGIRLRYFGHASALLEANGATILTDPFIAVSPLQKGADRFTFGDLPEKIDYALITHGRHDHFVFESLLGLMIDNLDRRVRTYLAQLQLDHKVNVAHGVFSTAELSQSISAVIVLAIEYGTAIFNYYRSRQLL